MAAAEQLKSRAADLDAQIVAKKGQLSAAQGEKETLEPAAVAAAAALAGKNAEIAAAEDQLTDLTAAADGAAGSRYCRQRRHRCRIGAEGLEERVPPPRPRLMPSGQDRGREGDACRPSGCCQRGRGRSHGPERRDCGRAGRARGAASRGRGGSRRARREKQRDHLAQTELTTLQADRSRRGRHARCPQERDHCGERRITALEQQIAAKNTEITAKQAQLTTAQNELAALQVTRTALEAEIAAITTDRSHHPGQQRREASPTGLAEAQNRPNSPR